MGRGEQLSGGKQRVLFMYAVAAAHLLAQRPQVGLQLALRDVERHLRMRGVSQPSALRAEAAAAAQQRPRQGRHLARTAARRAALAHPPLATHMAPQIRHHRLRVEVGVLKALWLEPGGRLARSSCRGPDRWRGHGAWRALRPARAGHAGCRCSPQSSASGPVRRAIAQGPDHLKHSVMIQSP